MSADAGRWTDSGGDDQGDDLLARRLATAGIAGRIHRHSRIEALRHRRDVDRAHWLGIQTFTRPTTAAERALIAPHADATALGAIHTRVDVCGGVWRRSWPALFWCVGGVL